MRLSFILCAVLALGACIDRSYTPSVPAALAIGTPYTVFAATTRERRPNGSFGYGRSESVDLLELTVSIPPNHTPGDLQFAYAQPDPVNEFTIADQRLFGSADAFVARVAETLGRLPADQREVVVFVHGFNVTQAETAMRAAQLAHDIKLSGTMVIYSWPSRGRPLGYAYDTDSMMFARDGLEQLLRQLRAAGVGNILLVAHSMGSILAMETLRQADIREPGWSKRALRSVILISPDIDVEVFRSQMQSLDGVPSPFVIMVSEKDRILNLSARLRGTADRERLGNIRNSDRIADLPVEVVDTTRFSRGAGSEHFVPATSPALIAIFRDAQATARSFGSEKLAIELLLPASTGPRQDAIGTSFARRLENPG